MRAAVASRTARRVRLLREGVGSTADELVVTTGT
jgi:hypothetical protein